MPQWLAPFGLQTISTGWEIARLAVPVMAPVSLLSGLLFTRLGTDLRAHAMPITGATAVLTLANTADVMLFFHPCLLISTLLSFPMIG